MLSRDSQESRAAADRQSQRQPTRTIDRPKRERDADIDPHIPLPKLTREQKAEGTSTEMTRPDSRIRTPNSTPNYTEATKRKAQSQLEEKETHQPSASSSWRHSNHTSDPSDPDGSMEAHESSSTPKEEETRSAKGRKRHAVNQLDEERRPRVEMQASEDAKSHTREGEEDPDIRDQSEIAKNPITREGTKTDTSRGDKRTVEGAKVNSNSRGEARPPKQVHAETSESASQGAILGASCDEGDRIIAQGRGKRKRNPETGEPAKEEQQRAGGKKAKEKAEAASVIGRVKKIRERCQVCNGVISSAESGTQCPLGPKELGFVPGAATCRDCVAHLLKRLQWYLEEQLKKYPESTREKQTESG